MSATLPPITGETIGQEVADEGFLDTTTPVAPSSSSSGLGAPSSGGGLGGLFTSLAAATQEGIGLANYASGGSPINLTTGQPTGTTTIAGFSVTTIAIIAVLLIGVVIAIHYVTK